MKASPAVRQLALEHGLDLGSVVGSGPDGRIVRTDVAALINGPAPPAELTRTQALIARRMTEARQTVPEFAVSLEIDMERLWQVRRGWRDGGAALVPSFNDFVIKACALVLRAHPYANASYRDDRLEMHSEVNVGVAVGGERMLVVPVIRHADEKSLVAIAEESRALAQAARAGILSVADMADATFTVSNLGMFGVDVFEAVINPPQAAILAVGSVRQRAVVRAGELAAAHTMWVTLACDHRVLYGADAARFVAELRRLLETPEPLCP